MAGLRATHTPKSVCYPVLCGHCQPSWQAERQNPWASCAFSVKPHFLSAMVQMPPKPHLAKLWPPFPIHWAKYTVQCDGIPWSIAPLSAQITETQCTIERKSLIGWCRIRKSRRPWVSTSDKGDDIYSRNCYTYTSLLCAKYWSDRTCSLTEIPGTGRKLL